MYVDVRCSDFNGPNVERFCPWYNINGNCYPQGNSAMKWGRSIWFDILNTQLETRTIYMLYKACSKFYESLKNAFSSNCLTLKVFDVSTQFIFDNVHVHDTFSRKRKQNMGTN